MLLRADLEVLSMVLVLALVNPWLVTTPLASMALVPSVQVLPQLELATVLLVVNLALLSPAKAWVVASQALVCWVEVLPCPAKVSVLVKDSTVVCLATILADLFLALVQDSATKLTKLLAPTRMLLAQVLVVWEMLLPRPITTTSPASRRC